MLSTVRSFSCKSLNLVPAFVHLASTDPLFGCRENREEEKEKEKY